MRTIFFKRLFDEMKVDKRLFLVVADMGLGLVEPFQQEFPDRYLNVGIAEQNMIGISAGLCNCGFRPVCYTISNFLIQRCFEQIRNDVCLHSYPVILVGASTGYDNGSLGPTHQVIDDIGCLKALPYIRIYSPGSVQSSREAFNEVIREQTPAYVRIGKGSYSLPADITNVNHMAVENSGAKTLVITHGNVLEFCIAAAQTNPTFNVFCMNKIKPIDAAMFKSLCSQYSNIVVVEDQLVGAGLYNSLCQIVCESGLGNIKILSIAPPDAYEAAVGDRNYFAEKYGFSPVKINAMLSKIG